MFRGVWLKYVCHFLNVTSKINFNFNKIQTNIFAQIFIAIDVDLFLFSVAVATSHVLCGIKYLQESDIYVGK